MPHRSIPGLAALIIDNAVAYAIITLRPDGTVTGWMAGAEAITGYSAAEAVGMNFAALYTPPDRAADAHLAELEAAARNGRVEDTRWHVRKDGELFWANGLTMRVDQPGFDDLVKIFRDETPVKRADEQRVLLLNELNHRVNNTLSTVQSVAEQTLRSAGVDVEVRRTLSDRLVALAEAHRILVDQTWAGAELGAVIDNVIRPHQRIPPVFLLEGPDVRLSPAQAISCSLALHELLTNAIKYGALKVPGGTVGLSWNLWQDGQGRRNLRLLWEERGGPPVAPPGREGFGSRLIRRAFDDARHGSARIDFRPEGVRCLMEMRLPDRDDGARTLDLREGALRELLDRGQGCSR